MSKIGKFLLNTKTLQLSPQPLHKGRLLKEYVPQDAIALTDEQYLYFAKAANKRQALYDILNNKFKDGVADAKEQKLLYERNNTKEVDEDEEKEATATPGAEFDVNSFEPWSNQKISRANRENLLKYAREGLGVPDITGDEEIEVLRAIVKKFQEQILGGGDE